VSRRGHCRFSEAIRIDPKEAAAYFNRGLAWRSKGVYDNAIADYNQALALNPNSFQAYINRGVAWGRKGEYDKPLRTTTRRYSSSQ